MRQRTIRVITSLFKVFVSQVYIRKAYVHTGTSSSQCIHKILTNLHLKRKKPWLSAKMSANLVYALAGGSTSMSVYMPVVCVSVIRLHIHADNIADTVNRVLILRVAPVHKLMKHF